MVFSILHPTSEFNGAEVVVIFLKHVHDVLSTQAEIFRYNYLEMGISSLDFFTSTRSCNLDRVICAHARKY